MDKRGLLVVVCDGISDLWVAQRSLGLDWAEKDHRETITVVFA